MRLIPDKLLAGFLFSTLLLGACGGGNAPGGGGGGGGGGNQGLKNLSFGTPTTLPAGTVPSKAQSLFVSDFTNDQKLDFAVINDAISVFVGNGDGTFQAKKDATKNPAATTPTALAAGEFDTLPNVDLVTSMNGNQVDIFFDPNQDGQFADNAPFAAGTAPEGVAVADFNGDGKPDIATANGAEGFLTVKLNNGGVTFADHSFNSGGKLTGPRNLVAADFNGDNKPDVAIADFGGDRLAVWTNTGDANPANLFPAANLNNTLALPAGAGVQGVMTADFNGDSKPDLAAANPNGKNVSVFLNQGGGNFTAGPLLPAGADAFAAAAADFNKDGKLDLVVVNAFGVNGTDGDFCVYLGKGDGSFEAPKTFTAGVDAASLPNHPRSVAVGDFNGDGKPDLVVANSPGDSVAVILNTSN
ncbi:MAG: VCBS repeat-containing protein [bacterium]